MDGEHKENPGALAAQPGQGSCPAFGTGRAKHSGLYDPHPETSGDPFTIEATGVAAQAVPTHREGGEDYIASLFLLGGRHRVILCGNGIQYILQRRYADGFRGATWKPLSHHATRKSLRQACERLGLLSEPSAPHAIDDLPEHARHLAMIAPKGGTTTQ